MLDQVHHSPINQLKIYLSSLIVTARRVYLRITFVSEPTYIIIDTIIASFQCPFLGNAVIDRVERSKQS